MFKPGEDVWIEYLEQGEPPQYAFVGSRFKFVKDEGEGLIRVRPSGGGEDEVWNLRSLVVTRVVRGGPPAH